MITKPASTESMNFLLPSSSLTLSSNWVMVLFFSSTFPLSLKIQAMIFLFTFESSSLFSNKTIKTGVKQ